MKNFANEITYYLKSSFSFALFPNFLFTILILYLYQKYVMLFLDMFKTKGYYKSVYCKDLTRRVLIVY